MSVEGESLVELLDNYLKVSVKGKKIEPFGGALYEEYDYAWNLPGSVAWLIVIVLVTTFHCICSDFDMNALQEGLKEQKRVREKAAKNRTLSSQRKEQYMEHVQLVAQNTRTLILQDKILKKPTTGCNN